MESAVDTRRPHTFVVQVAANGSGELAGLIRHVRTGEKRRFEGLDGLNTAIRGMVDGDVTDKEAP